MEFISLSSRGQKGQGNAGKKRKFLQKKRNHD